MIVLLFNCEEEDKTALAIQELDITVSISRFDQDFANASASDLPMLKTKYPYLFPAKYADSVWIAKMQDTIQEEISNEVHKAFGDFKPQEQELVDFFKHVKYYFPKYKVPRIITVTNDVDYNTRIILADSLLFIGLDSYLGADHHFYTNEIPRYLAAGLDKQYLISDVASSFSNKTIGFPRDRSFLAQMIYYGKELYLKDKLIPAVSDAQKIGYSVDQLTWVKVNEEQIWRYFIDQELLYSTDTKLAPRFLLPAPFSKFRLEFDNESPGRVGRYMGWQIVRAFMENNEIGLSEMLTLPGEEIFKKSKYKPKQ